MHPLAQYLTNEGISVEEFIARMAAMELRAPTKRYIDAIIKGRRWPSRSLAKAMEQAAGGRVLAADLLTFDPTTIAASPAS